ncbi:MAG TPA: vanadium-dependent haloperoxidase [Pyrinomonadaceae bacterium]|nr:vanadium-dependent haloperoxidase [Pyrinomonadaceae bacterium]
MTEKNEQQTESNLSNQTASRRQFLGRISKTAIAAAALGAVAPLVDKKSEALGQTAKREAARGAQTFYQNRANACYQWRAGVAHSNLAPIPPFFDRANNGDELLYASRIGNYSKGLPHQSNGEVVPTAYNALLDALRTGNPTAFEQIPLGGDRKLTNPQSGLAFDLEGKDAFHFVQPPPPAFASKETAAEIAENYWMAFLRDVPFAEYENNAIAQAAAADLTLFGADFKGAKDTNGQVTPRVLFRGLTPGDKAGPYLSQFFLKPCFFGANEINQRIHTVLPVGAGGQNYLTDFNSWLAAQNGVSPAQADLFDPTPRYMRNGRDLGQWVHIDVLFQAYFQAFLVIAGSGVPADGGNPYSNSATQIGFGTFGGPHVATLLCEVSTRALKAVWNQKWFVHRRLRPEAFAERVDRRAYHGANYPVHQEILNSVTTASRLGGHLPPGNAFLPQAFPEGSPTHPAYGAGHATVAGACVTILKAWFNESTVIQNPVVPDAAGLNLVPYGGSENLTVGGELNKMAANVALGRNMAGVHWRSDATESLLLGEALAISILRDQKSGYNEQFSGFSLTKFDGTTITV